MLSHIKAKYIHFEASLKLENNADEQKCWYKGCFIYSIQDIEAT